MKIINNTSKFELTILVIAILFSIKVNKAFSQVTDIDGNTYNTTIIDNREWTAENLNVSHYRNGDLIPEVKDASEWQGLTTGAWCYYKNNTSNGKIYGKLYNWYAVNDSRGLAPEGWKIPTKENWMGLITATGSEFFGGAQHLKSINYWKPESPDQELAPRTNKRNFNALPGGYRDVTGSFCCIEGFCTLWSSSELQRISSHSGNDNFAIYIDLTWHSSNVNIDNYNKKNGLSVRCVKDE